MPSSSSVSRRTRLVAPWSEAMSCGGPAVEDEPAVVGEVEQSAAAADVGVLMAAADLELQRGGVDQRVAAVDGAWWCRCLAGWPAPA